MENKVKIYNQGLDEYPKSSIILGNFLMLLWISLGVIACWFLHPLAALIYIAFVVIMIFVVLRKLVCTNCYYYDKWCHIGWGKLSAMFFKKGSIKKFTTGVGIKIAPLVYGLLTLIPIIFLIISIFNEVTLFRLSVMILLLIINFYSGTVSRKKSCKDCRMRLICPGSSIKEIPNGKIWSMKSK